MGAHGQRQPPEPVVGRRHPVLREPVLPRAGHRDRLRRRQVVGHPAPDSQHRFSRGAHCSQSRQRSRQARRPHRGRLRLRGLVRGEGRPAQEGQEISTRRTRAARSRVHPRHLPAVHHDHRERAREVRRERPHLLGDDPAPRRMANGHRSRGRKSDHGRACRRAGADRSPTCSATWIAGSTRHPSCEPIPLHSCRRIAAVSWISRRCDSRHSPRAGTASRPRDFRGS